MAAKQVISSCGQDKNGCEMYRNFSIVKCTNKFMTLFCRGCARSFVSLVGLGGEHFHAFSLESLSRIDQTGSKMDGISGSWFPRG